MSTILFCKTTKVNLQDDTLPSKTYAVAQSRSSVDLDGLGEHMSSHGCAYDAGDITAILKKTVICVRELLKDGYIVHLGDLGTFSITLKSKGVAESVADDETGEKPVFTAADITGINVNWTRSSKFDSSAMMDGVTFEETITTKAKAAELKTKSAALAAGTYNPSGKTTTSSGS